MLQKCSQIHNWLGRGVSKPRNHYETLTIATIHAIVGFVLPTTELQTMPKDLFATVPEFLAAFNDLHKDGFFEKVEFSEGGYDCSIHITGYVPSSEQYKMEGCGNFIDPNAIVAHGRRLADRNLVKDIATKVEITNWPQICDDLTWNDDHIGSRGKRYELNLCIMFKTWPRHFSGTKS